jgi:hypothetical protein
MSDRDAAGINSPHNACQFRADCRKAEAEIARLRKVLTEIVADCADFVAAGEFGDSGTAKQLIEHFDSARKDTK